MNRDVNRYIKDIKKLLPLSTKKDKDYFKRTSQIIYKETESFPDITYDECVTRYGNPKSIVQSYIDDLDSELVLQNLNRRKLFKRNLFVISSIIIILAIAVYVHMINRTNQIYEQVKQSQPIQVETTITEESTSVEE